jgi:hypothetical protein
MGSKMATKNCNPSQLFSLFHDYPIMINLFNNFEALVGRWGRGKEGLVVLSHILIMRLQDLSCR